MRHLSSEHLSAAAEPFLEQLGIGLIEADLASGKVHLDEAALRLFGGDPDWLLDGVMFSRFLQQVDVNDRDCFCRCIGMIDSQSRSFITEYRTYPDSNRTCWVLVRGRGYFDENGLLFRVVGIVVDVTALKSDDRSYVSPVPGGESLNDLADLIIAARRLVDHLALDEMRPLINDLLMQVGMQLGADIRRQARTAFQ